MARKQQGPGPVARVFEALDNDPHRLPSPGSAGAAMSSPELVRERWRFNGALRARVRKAVDGAVSVDELRTIVGEYAAVGRRAAPADAGPRGGAADGAAGLRPSVAEQWGPSNGRWVGLFNGQPATAHSVASRLAQRLLVSLGPGRVPKRRAQVCGGRFGDIPLGR